MPSKSKSQARFFAAAAHNPDFAKKAGISTKAAKEWNKADEKAGTLKKGSDKPEKVKEEVFFLLATIEDKKVEEVKEQSMMVTIKSLKDLLGNKELVELFKSAM